MSPQVFVNVPAFCRVEHLGDVEPRRCRQSAPFLPELTAVGHRDVAGQKIGIDPHVGRAAGICVVGERNQFCAGNTGGEFRQRMNPGAEDLGSENNDQAFFPAKLVAHL